MQGTEVGAGKVKLSCDSCGARYRIPLAKVQGRRFRATCRSCGATIFARLTAGELSTRTQDFAAADGPQWYLALEGEPAGPFSVDEIRNRLHEGIIHGETFAWRDGARAWMPLGEIPELRMWLDENEARAALFGSMNEAEEQPTRAIGGRAARDHMGAITARPAAVPGRPGERVPYDGAESEPSTDEHRAAGQYCEQAEAWPSAHARYQRADPALADTFAVEGPGGPLAAAAEPWGVPDRQRSRGAERGGAAAGAAALDFVPSYQEAQPAANYVDPFGDWSDADAATRLAQRQAVPQPGDLSGEIADPDAWSHEIDLRFGTTPGKVGDDATLASARRDAISDPKLWVTGIRSSSLPAPPGGALGQEGLARQLVTDGLAPPPGPPPPRLERPEEDSMLIEPELLEAVRDSAEESDVVAFLVPELPMAVPPAPVRPMPVPAAVAAPFWTARRLVIVGAATGAFVVTALTVTLIVVLKDRASAPVALGKAVSLRHEPAPTSAPAPTIKPVLGSVGNPAAAPEPRLAAAPAASPTAIDRPVDAAARPGPKAATSRAKRRRPAARRASRHKPGRARRVKRRHAAPRADDVDSMLGAAAARGSGRPARSSRGSGRRASGGDSADGILAAAAGSAAPARGLPKKLSRGQIVAGMRKLRGRAQVCFERFGQQGVLKLSVTIFPNGRARGKVIGSFRATPTGACVAAGLPGLHFPPFRGKPLTVVYPLQLK